MAKAAFPLRGLRWLALIGLGPAACLAQPQPGAEPAPRQGDLGALNVRTLQSFAARLGMAAPSGGDDQPMFDAANAAIAAAGEHGGLIVVVGPGTYKARALVGANRGGYVCLVSQTCVIAQERAPEARAASYLFTNAGPYDTGVVFEGFVLNGGWSYGRGPYADRPEADPWLGAQHAVALNKAFSGVKDEAFVAHSAVQSQIPKDRIHDLVIGNFGGDGLQVVGAGANIYSDIRVQNVGGHCLKVDGYDSDYYGLDLGGCGLSGIYGGLNFAQNRLDFKIWYAGQRMVAGDNVGFLIVPRGGGANVARGLIQDTYCDGVRDGGYNNRWDINVQWQGAIPTMCKDAAAYVSLGAAAPQLTLNASILNAQFPHPQVTKVVRDLPGADGRRLSRGHLDIIAAGFPGDVGAWNPAWFDGPIDDTNLVTLNSTLRAPQFWQPRSDNQQTAFGAVDTLKSGYGLFLNQAFDSATLAAGRGGLCIDGARGGAYSPCAVHVDSRGALQLNLGGVLTTPGTAAGHDVGTAGAAVGLLNGANTYSGPQTFAAGVDASGYASSGAAGVSCKGPPSPQFAVRSGIVVHC